MSACRSSWWEKIMTRISLLLRGAMTVVLGLVSPGDIARAAELRGARFRCADLCAERTYSGVRECNGGQAINRVQSGRRSEETHSRWRNRRRDHPDTADDGRPSEAKHVGGQQPRERGRHPGFRGGSRGRAKARYQLG